MLRVFLFLLAMEVDVEFYKKFFKYHSNLRALLSKKIHNNDSIFFHVLLLDNLVVFVLRIEN